MLRTRSQWIAASSALVLLAAVLEAARRPRYGGELRIETREAVSSIDPATPATNAQDQALKSALLCQVFETLVRFDESGEVQPWLATGWTHEAAHKRWMFTARANVILQDGSPWVPPTGVISISDKKPIAEILRELSQPANAIAVREPNGTLVGTGPFRIARWEAGKTIRLEAHEEYWRGRPYLDAVEVRTIRESRARLLDLDLAKTDVAEAEVADVRQLQQAGVAMQISRTMETLALVFENPDIPVITREALALSIDRVTIQRVLLDRQGEASGALLPQWLSGYAFLFPARRDLARARTLSRASSPLTLNYDRDDPVIRSIGERIAVNASEAGLIVRYSSDGSDVRLERLPLMSFDSRRALEDYAAMLSAPAPSPGSPYEAELALLENHRVIPLFHLPLVYALRGNVRNWTAAWRLDDVWLENLKAVS